jgi:hypothetical protein
MVVGKYRDHIHADLANGRIAIEEFLRVTANLKVEVDVNLARDVLALARELGATSIAARAQEAMAKLHTDFGDQRRCEAELQLSTAATERQLRSLSIPEFVAVAGQWELELPVLDRSVPAVEESGAGRCCLHSLSSASAPPITVRVHRRFFAICLHPNSPKRTPMHWSVRDSIGDSHRSVLFPCFRGSGENCSRH